MTKTTTITHSPHQASLPSGRLGGGLFLPSGRLGGGLPHPGRLGGELPLSSCSLTAAAQRAGLAMEVVDGRPRFRPLDTADPRYATDFILPSERMVEACRADDHTCLAPWIAARRLTTAQAQHAAQRYRLGRTRSGRTLYWMIDELREPLDAHIEPDGWLSTLLRQRQPLLSHWRADHCLFGLHLLAEEEDTAAGRQRPVFVVEREASAVVLAELFPEGLWMAYVSPMFLEPALFEPLRGRQVTIYPPTDLTYTAYPLVADFAAMLRRRSLHVSVASLLEDHATDEQKARGIDLLEFIYDNENLRTLKNLRPQNLNENRNGQGI